MGSAPTTGHQDMAGFGLPTQTGSGRVDGALWLLDVLTCFEWMYCKAGTEGVKA